MELSKLKCNWCKEKICKDCSARYLKLQTEKKLDPYIYESLSKYGNTTISDSFIKTLGGESKVILDIKNNLKLKVRLRKPDKKNTELKGIKIIELI